MKKLIFVIFLFLVQAANAQENNDWVKSMGGNQTDQAKAIDVDIQGNIYITGAIQSNAVFGGQILHPQGDTDLFISKLSPEGKLLWAKKAGSSIKKANTITEYGSAIGVSNTGELYVAGVFSSMASFDSIQVISEGKDDIFLAKYSSNGKLLWVESLGGSSQDVVKDLAIDEEGNIYMTGFFQKTMTVNDEEYIAENGAEFFISKHNQDGELLWIRHSGTKKMSAGIAIDVSGASIYVGGEFQGEFKLREESFTSTGGKDVFFCKYDKDGLLQWVNSLGGYKQERVNDLRVFNEQVYFTGSFSQQIKKDKFQINSVGKSDVLWGSWSSNGTLSNLQSLGGEYDDIGRGIQQTASGQIVVSGTFKEKIQRDQLEILGSGFQDIFWASFDQTDSLINLRKIGGQGQEYINDMALKDNYIYLAGSYMEELDGEKFNLSAKGQSDIFIGKFESGLILESGLTSLLTFPNPTTGKLNIQFSQQNPGDIEISIFDISGVKMIDLIIQNETRVDKKLDLSSLASGVYIMKASTIDGHIERKIILTH